MTEREEKIPLADWIGEYMRARSYQIRTFEALLYSKPTEEVKQRAIQAEEKLLEVVNKFPVKPTKTHK